MNFNIEFFFIILSVFFQSMTIVLGKYASITMKEFTPINIALNPFYIGVLVCLGLQAIFWQQALKYYKLSFAYIFTSLVYVFILLSSYFLFNEKVNLFNIIGTFVIIIGLIFMVSIEGKNV